MGIEEACLSHAQKTALGDKCKVKCDKEDPGDDCEECMVTEITADTCRATGLGCYFCAYSIGKALYDCRHEFPPVSKFAKCVYGKISSSCQKCLCSVVCSFLLLTPRHSVDF